MRLARAAAVGAALLWAGTAHASVIAVSQTQVLTSPGQALTFSFAGLPSPSGGDGMITVGSGKSLAFPGTPRDGLDLNGRGEYFDLSVDGSGLGRFACGTQNRATAIPGNTGGNNCDFSLQAPIGGSVLADLLSDGSADIKVDFGRAVSPFGHMDEVIVSLRYDVTRLATFPLPASALLLAGGLAGLVVLRRRR